MAEPVVCPKCHGTGKDLVPDGNHGMASMGKCPRCKGKKTMTEPAPSQGVFTTRDAMDSLTSALVDTMRAEIDVLTQQLAAERARADALDEENKRLREAITSKHGTPSSLIEGLRAYAASAQNAEKAWHATMADKLESAIHQPKRSE